MSTRVKTAAVAGTLFLAVLFVGGALLFGLMVAVAAAVGVHEALHLGEDRPGPVEGRFAAVWGGVMALGFLPGVGALPGALLAVGTVIYFAGWIRGPGPVPEMPVRWGQVAAAWVLVALFLGHAVWIRRHGPFAVLFPMLVVWAGDIAAYYVGSAIGKRKLAPGVSPNKSVEGALASVAAAAGMGVAASAVLPLPHSVLAGGVLGLVLNVLAQYGDLIESLLKRCAGCKDSGTIFPGHGGLLDRIDALLPVLPVYAGYLAWVARC
ncbi:MAG: phosphatidate cytidylyltransferase [Deferrisomatales bacterium]|nr:phosphatidate cytidylyltransferase [Deferrisomatales bacterium]